MDNTDPDTGLREKTVWAYTVWAAFDCIKRMAVALYIYDGWDDCWAFPDMPRWLRPRYLAPEWDLDRLKRGAAE